jgi:hypothetical protein
LNATVESQRLGLEELFIDLVGDTTAVLPQAA